jgi:hypothetical protein
MPFLGKSSGARVRNNNVLLDAISASATATYNLTKGSVAYPPAGATSLQVSLNGITQAPISGYTVVGSQLIFDSALTSNDVIDYVVAFEGLTSTVAVSDASVTVAKIADDAVTADKLANSINSAIAANTAKVTNATHTGDVTGGAALTIANNAVDIAKLNVTDGTSGQFLKTDGNNVLSFGTVAAPVLSYNAWVITATAVTAVNGSQIMVTGTSAVTITLPAGVAGHSVSVRNNSSATVTIARNGSDKINSTADNGEIAASAGSQLVYANSTLGWMEV